MRADLKRINSYSKQKDNQKTTAVREEMNDTIQR
jgi:hypothetical protein